MYNKIDIVRQALDYSITGGNWIVIRWWHTVRRVVIVFFSCSCCRCFYRHRNSFCVRRRERAFLLLERASVNLRILNWVCGWWSIFWGWRQIQFSIMCPVRSVAIITVLGWVRLLVTAVNGTSLQRIECAGVVELILFTSHQVWSIGRVFSLCVNYRVTIATFVFIDTITLTLTCEGLCDDE